MKASLKAKYATNKGAAPPVVTAGAATITFNAGEIKLRASLTDATVVHGPSLNGLAFAVEKPGSFIIDYDVPKQDVRFQFMNSVRAAGKQFNFTFMHNKDYIKPELDKLNDESEQGHHLKWKTALNGTLVLDSANKVSANHVVGSKNLKLKYTYVHGGLTTFEPSCDLKTQAWDFAVSRRIYDNDLFKATYQPTNHNLGLEWSRSSKVNGSLKIAATFDLTEELRFPKLAAETTWDLEM